MHRIDGGTAIEHYVIGPQISDRIRRGEVEHVNDFMYAHLLVSQTISQILYRLLSVPRPEASSAEAAVDCAWGWLRSALPPQLRWEPSQDRSRLRFMWLQRQNTLAGVTMRRDSRGWHSVARNLLIGREKARYGIPAAEIGYEVVPGDSQIDQHPTEDLIQHQWWSSLPTFP